MPDSPAHVPSIADLKDIAPPPPVSYAPQAAGWWVLGAIVLLAILAYGFVRWRRWRRNRYRREAQAELAALAQAIAHPDSRNAALAAMPALVKRTVLAWAPRAQAGPLSGEAWLRYLDGTFAAGGFTQGPGRALDTLAYGRGDIADDELAALLELLHRWIDGHVAT